MKVVLSSVLAAGSLLLGSCATIVSQSGWPVAMSSVPMGAAVAVVDRHGKQVYAGITPTAVELKANSGFFRRAKYTITFTKPGFATKTIPLEADVNGWYFGNVAFGGFVGLLIVDPATGAMYRIGQKAVQVALTQTTGYAPGPVAAPGLRIMAFSEVPDNLRPLLVPIKQ